VGSKLKAEQPWKLHTITGGDIYNKLDKDFLNTLGFDSFTILPSVIALYRGRKQFEIVLLTPNEGDEQHEVIIRYDGCRHKIRVPVKRIEEALKAICGG